MLNRVVAHLSTIVLLSLCCAGAASALGVSGPGLDAGGACPAGGACAPIDYDFDVTPAPATGSIDFTPAGGINWTVDIDIAVATLTMEDTGGAIDGVDRIVFSDLHFVVDDWAAIQFGGSIAGVTTTGTVSGSYEQFLGGGSVVGSTSIGATPLTPVSVSYGSLNCADTLTGQCGFTVGFSAPELNLDIGTTGSGSPYKFVWTFNVVVPEPSTASLLGLGLVGIASLRRRRV